MAVAEATHLKLHDSITLAVEKAGYAAGTRGVVVDAYPDAERFTVELVDGNGDTLDLVDVLAREVRLRKSWAPD
jgi:3-deoxy-D-arabino-heptulosonate 7-phosphate (DAHP) synthase